MACLHRPTDRDARPVFYRRGRAVAGNPRLLAYRVDGEPDAVRDAAGLDHRLAHAAVEHERHGEDRLQGVALLPPARADIGRARTGAGRKVEKAVDGLGRDAGAVVGDGDLAGLGRDRDCNLRRDLGLLGDVEPVVDQLLHGDERPALGPVTGLNDQLPLAAEVEQAGGGENLADEARRRRSHIRLGYVMGAGSPVSDSIPGLGARHRAEAVCLRH